MATGRPELTREQILGYRRRVGSLDRRLPAGSDSMRQAAWAGLQDSMPRAAVLSLHARMSGTDPEAWADPSLVQVWGPRFSAYVVAAEDRAIFTVGRLPDDAKGLERAESTARRLSEFLGDRRMTYGEAGRAMGVSPNSLRYAAPTGTVLIHWDGARQPVVWIAPRPDVDPLEARLELARRHLHVFGPATADSFSAWAGIRPPRARDAYARLTGSLVPVATPVGAAWILAADEALLRADPPTREPARLLPSGDAYYLLQGAERELLVPDAARRDLLWTSRVWPGAVLVGGEVVGIWRRSQAKVTIEPWRTLTHDEKSSIAAEAESFPLPGIEGGISVAWDE